MNEKYETLTQLGRNAGLPESPDKAVLEFVSNPHPGTVYLVRFAAPEFTSLCPITGQPDFAHLVIDYVPGETIVESKSLKLFLGMSEWLSLHRQSTPRSESMPSKYPTIRQRK